MVTRSQSYPARLSIDYPEKLDRVSTFFRLIWAVPIFVILALLTATATDASHVPSHQVLLPDSRPPETR